MSDLSPPWVLFCDGRKPVAILPAGRPGEVCNVSKLTMKQAQAIVRAANQPIRDAQVRLVALTEKVLALNDAVRAEATK